MFRLFRKNIPQEAALWLGALVFLAVFGPSLTGHVTFCVPTLLGFDGCWGCGLGHSIGSFLHGNIEEALWAHPMGIPAVAILVYRSATLIKDDNQETEQHSNSIL